MIKHEVPIITMHQLGDLISNELNIDTMNYFLDSSSIPKIIYNEVTARIPYNNSDRFNTRPHKNIRHLADIIGEIRKLYK